jgi:hypothetical protein
LIESIYDVVVSLILHRGFYFFILVPHFPVWIFLIFIYELSYFIAEIFNFKISYYSVMLYQEFLINFLNFITFLIKENIYFNSLFFYIMYPFYLSIIYYYYNFSSSNFSFYKNIQNYKLQFLIILLSILHYISLIFNSISLWYSFKN